MLFERLRDEPAPEATDQSLLEQFAELFPEEPDVNCAEGRHEAQPIKAAGGVTLGHLCKHCHAKCGADGSPPPPKAA